MKKNLFYILRSLILSSNIYCQGVNGTNYFPNWDSQFAEDRNFFKDSENSVDSYNNENSLSKFYINGTIGFSEVVGISFGYYIDSSSALAIKYNSILLPKKSMAIATCFALKYSIFFSKIKFINNFSITTSFMLKTSDEGYSYKNNPFIKGAGVELAVGKIDRYKRNFSFFYEFGATITSVMPQI